MKKSPVEMHQKNTQTQSVRKSKFKVLKTKYYKTFVTIKENISQRI